MIATAELARDLHTRHGTYCAGLPVVVLGVAGLGTRRVCIDGGQHLGQRCHTVNVPGDWLRKVKPDTRDPQTVPPTCGPIPVDQLELLLAQMTNHRGESREDLRRRSRAA